jgi:hypothetical protein
MNIRRLCHVVAVMGTLLTGLAHAAAPTITSLAPTSGPIATKLVIKGTNFTGASKVTIDGTAATFAVNSAAQITANVPATASGVVQVTTGGGTATSASSFTVTPGASVSPATGSPTTAVTVTGSGFDKFSSIDVYFDSTDLALGVSNGSGVVSVKLTLPSSATAGAHWITLDERATHVAGQVAVTVNTNWLMHGFNAYGRGFNPYEGALTRSNVNTLALAWQVSVPGASPTAMVEADGNLYVAFASGIVNAYSSAGALIWTASPSDKSTSPSLAAADGLVLLSGSETVYAYKLLCAAKGATCTPAWSQGIGTTISSGLTVANNLLYVPGGDGQIHPLNPVNGTPGTPFIACNDTDGPVTTPIQFSGGGSFFYGTGDIFQGIIGTFGCGAETLTNPVSQGAIDTDTGTVFVSDATLFRFGALNDWQVTLPGNTDFCSVPAPPAIAYGYVYAGCGGIGAYTLVSGDEIWLGSPGGSIFGTTVAGGVVYACLGATLTAFDAYNGSYLWGAGADCNQAPVVVNGTVYTGYYSVDALTPQGVVPAAARRPVVSELIPDMTLAPDRTPERLP